MDDNDDGTPWESFLDFLVKVNDVIDNNVFFRPKWALLDVAFLVAITLPGVRFT